MTKDEKDKTFRLGLGICAMQDFCRTHKISFQIRFNPSHGHWSITVMSNNFQKYELSEALAEAIKLVLRVKDPKQYNELFNKPTTPQ